MQKGLYAHALPVVNLGRFRKPNLHGDEKVQMAEDRNQKTDDRRQRTEDRNMNSEVGIRNAEKRTMNIEIWDLFDPILRSGGG
jgi:hypothetical protein